MLQFHSKNNLQLRTKVGIRNGYRPRRMSQAMKPETFKPMTSATALLWPIDESCPFGRKRKGCVGRPLSFATMFAASCTWSHLPPVDPN